MNKNTKQLRSLARKAGKSKNPEFAIEMPTHGYHNSSKGNFATRRVPTAVRGNDGVVSASKCRNTQMRILQNAGGGQGSSLTVHEATDKTVPVMFKNHAYMRKDEHGKNNYRQLPNVR